MFSINPKNWFNKSVIPTETKSTTIGLPNNSFLAHVFGVGTTINAAQAAHFYQNTSAIATSVDMIAESIEQITPVIQTGDETFIENHPILDLFKQPNGFDGWSNFIGTIARNYLLNRDSLISAAGNVKHPPIELWPVMMQSVSIMQHVDTYPNSYTISQGALTGIFSRDESNRKNGTRFYDGNLKELFHIKGYSSGVMQLQGDSPLQAAANEAKQIIKGKAHNLRILDNGGRLSLLIAFKDEDMIEDDDHKKRVQRINEQYSGPENAGKIGVISNADIAEIKEFGINNKDMDYGNLETLAANAIYLRYKIPLALVSLKASTFNNLQTGVELFYDGAVLPVLDSIFEGLSSFLLPRFGMDPSKLKITYNPENIRQLKKRRIDEVEQRSKIGVETVNELRSLLPGRDDYTGDGGDELHSNGSSSTSRDGEQTPQDDSVDTTVDRDQ